MHHRLNWTAPCRSRWTPGSSPLARLLLAAICVVVVSPSAWALKLDEMSLDRWKKLRETERYQLNIAERYYAQKNWKVALAEYDKYLTLYEQSEAAPYALLKWSICQVNLRKPNTAIKEGFQSVIDYWPDSADAMTSAFYIGRAFKDMGELKKAKKAYRAVLSKHESELVAVYAMVDLIDISTVEQDEKTRVALWNKMTFDTNRKGDANRPCVKASNDLATYHFYHAALDEGIKALATSYKETDLPYYLEYYAGSPITKMTGDEKTKVQGEKFAASAVAYIKKAVPGDLAKEEEKARARQYWFYIADLYSHARQYDEVPKAYDQMIKLFGSDDGILGRLAGFYKGQNNYDKARATYTRYEDKIEGKNQIANSYREQNQIEPAVNGYRQLAALDSEREVRWVTEIASTYYNAKQWEKAIAVYEELAKLDPDNAQGHRWSVAYCYHNWGKYAEAIAHYRQCDRFPDNYVQMASCNRALKKYTEALLLYNQVMGGAPGRAPWALLQIGYTYEEAGKKELAIKSFQQVCRKFPKDGHASRAHAHLENKYKITIKLGGATDE